MAVAGSRASVKPYPRSKAPAERAAWDFIAREGGDTELVVANPTFILGPSLGTATGSSLQLVAGMLAGRLTTVRRQRSGIADVRDVADLHLRAMATPEARGRRYLALADGPTWTFLGMAQPLRDRARTELGWTPLPAETTILDTATSQRDLGLLAG